MHEMRLQNELDEHTTCKKRNNKTKGERYKMSEIRMIKGMCNKCGYEWTCRVNKPVACPRCKSRMDYEPAKRMGIEVDIK